MKQPFTRIGFGIFSLCTIFFILIMLILSIFFYQNANTKKINSDRYLQHVNEYYAADQKAIDLQEQLLQIQQEPLAVKQSFYEEHGMEVADEGHVVSYTIDINDQLQLDVKLHVDENNCTIQQWKVKGR